MRQIVTTIVFFVFITLIGVVVPETTGAANIKDLDYEVISNFATDHLDECTESRQLKNINGFKANACIFEQGSVSVGKYYDKKNITRVAASLTTDNNLYPVMIHGELFNCTYLRCLYSEASDTLINLEAVNGSYGLSPVLYKNFTKNLEFISDNTGKYLDYINPEREIMRPYGSAYGFGVDAGAVNISNNGKWMIAELKEVGIVRFNLVDGTHLRIYPDILEHRTAPVSSSELAIDDSGNNVFHVGLNAYIGMYRIDNNCGDKKLINEPLDNKCHRDDINPDKIIWSMNYSTTPSFIGSEGDSVKFYSLSTDPYLKYRKVHISGVGSNTSSLDLLSLGDSFTSGEGETNDNFYINGTNTEKEKCHLSSRSYPYLIGQALLRPSNKVRSVACSGAVTQDITGHASYKGQRNRLKDLTSSAVTIENLRSEAKQNFVPGRVEQQYFIKANRPKTVIVGIGGNDSGLMSKLNECALPNTCGWAENDELKASVGKEIKSLFGKLTNIYKKMKEDSSKSQIYAIGYPQIISSVPACRNLIGIMFNQKERIFINESLSYLNNIIEQSAINAGVKYLDIENAFGDNILCEQTTTPAMNGIRFGDDIQVLNMGKHIGSESFHPTPFGHEMIANYIKDKISIIENNISDEDVTAVGKIEPSSPSEYWGNYQQNNLIIRHLSTIGLEKNNTHDVFKDPIILPNSDFNVKVTNLEKNEVIFDEVVYSNDNSFIDMPQEVSSILSVEKGIYSLQIVGVSRLGERLMLYDTLINYELASSFYEDNSEEGNSIDSNEPLSNENENNTGAIAEIPLTKQSIASGLYEALLWPNTSLSSGLFVKPVFGSATNSFAKIISFQENEPNNVAVANNSDATNIAKDTKNTGGAVLGANTKKAYNLNTQSKHLPIVRYLAFSLIMIGIIYAILRRFKNV